MSDGNFIAPIKRSRNYLPKISRAGWADRQIIKNSYTHLREIEMAADSSTASGLVGFAAKTLTQMTNNARLAGTRLDCLGALETAARDIDAGYASQRLRLAT